MKKLFLLMALVGTFVGSRIEAAPCWASKGKRVPESIVQLAILQAKASVQNNKSISRSDASAAAAKLVGMMLEESGGQPVCSTDMSGSRVFSINDWTAPSASSKKWTPSLIETGYVSKKINQNKQSNYGLFQLSHDIYLNNKGTYGPILEQFLKVAQGDSATARSVCQSNLFYQSGDLFSPLKKCSMEIMGVNNFSGRACWARLSMACPVFNWRMASKKYSLARAYFESQHAKAKCYSTIFAALSPGSASQSKKTAVNRLDSESDADLSLASLSADEAFAELTRPWKGGDSYDDSHGDVFIAPNLPPTHSPGEPMKKTIGVEDNAI